MRKLLFGGLLLSLAIAAGGNVAGQDCGCGEGVTGGHRHFWPGPYGGANCGRDYSQSQAEALWAGYCTESCSLCNRGCGGFGRCGGLCGGGNCGGQCGGPFAGLAHVRRGDCNYPAGGAAPCGTKSRGPAPCAHGGKAGGQSIFNCQQWGWGNCGPACGCTSSSSSHRGLLGHFGDVGRSGRLFHPVGCDAGCDGGCDAGCDSSLPSAQATPTEFFRYQSSQNDSSPPPQPTFDNLPQSDAVESIQSTGLGSGF